MYKEKLTYTFFKAPENTWKVTRDFKTELEHHLYIASWMKNGFLLISEDPVKEIVEVYPQVLKLDLKSPGNSYYTVIERFTTSEEYQKYCEYKLMEGFKVIGSRPYFK